MRPGAIATLLLCAAVTPVSGADPQRADAAGKSYDQGGVRWSDRLSRFEPHAALCKAAGHRKCVFDSLVIRNDSDRDIRCAVRISYPQPNGAGIADLEAVEIITAGTERNTTQTTSEHPDLDAAALKLMQTAKLETACVGQRFRKTIPFTLSGR